MFNTIYIANPLLRAQEQLAVFGSENEKCARKLAQLKEQIRETERVANFASPKELGDLILRDMKAAIEEDYRGKTLFLTC